MIDLNKEAKIHIERHGITQAIMDSVEYIVRGRIGCFSHYILGHSQPYDPKLDVDFGEELLRTALNKLDLDSKAL